MYANLFGNRVFADAINLINSWWHLTGFRVGSEFNYWFLIRGEDAETHWDKKGHVKMKTGKLCFTFSPCNKQASPNPFFSCQRQMPKRQTETHKSLEDPGMAHWLFCFFYQPKEIQDIKKVHIYPFSLSNFKVPWESIGIQGDILKQANSTVYYCWLQNSKHSHIFFRISGHFFLGLLATLSYLLNLSSVNCPWAESLNPFSIHSLLNFFHLVF